MSLEETKAVLKLPLELVSSTEENERTTESYRTTALDGEPQLWVIFVNGRLDRWSL